VPGTQYSLLTLFRRLLHRALPYLDRKGEAPAWQDEAAGRAVKEWADEANVEISVEYRMGGAWLSWAPEVGPGWLATITPRAGGRTSRGMGVTQIEAVVEAQRRYRRRRPD
jgi:hypothetical protein